MASQDSQSLGQDFKLRRPKYKWPCSLISVTRDIRHSWWWLIWLWCSEICHCVVWHCWGTDAWCIHFQHFQRRWINWEWEKKSVTISEREDRKWGFPMKQQEQRGSHKQIRETVALPMSLFKEQVCGGKKTT
jgi:hypothetical protein